MEGQETFPSSKEEADKHIASRVRAPIDGSNDIVAEDRECLENLLSLIAQELYEKPTHFLLELIQNADDNSFTVEKPSLTLKLSKDGDEHTLLTTCNEVGLSLQNVKAITAAASSTKKAAQGKRGYIGEKGIGFKSIFKVARVVEISSGFYEFSLDSRTRLGMISPILSQFPPSLKRPDTTQFLLHLNSEAQYGEVRTELRSIDGRILMFLRSLTEFTIETEDRHVRFISTWERRHPKYLCEVQTIKTEDLRGDTVNEARFLIFRHKVRELKDDEKRKGITESEVMIAFPVSSCGDPTFESQSVYSFLPIGDFGWKFMIQADFLLTANREAVDYGRQWNLTLRRGLAVLFVNAAKALSGCLDEKIKFQWYKWLKCGGKGFWKELSSLINREVSNRPSFLTTGQSMTRPRGLLLYPSQFFCGGKPLIYDKEQAHKQLHLGYYKSNTIEASDIDILKELGVTECDATKLLSQLEQWIASSGHTCLHHLPEAWHLVFIQRFQGRENLWDVLRDLPLVPIRDGGWSAARTTNLFLASHDQADQTPLDLGLEVVCTVASQNYTRRGFFQWLGIKEYNALKVYDTILQHHSTYRPGATPARELRNWIADVDFLFKNRNLRPSKKDLSILHFVPQSAVARDEYCVSVAGRMLYYLDRDRDGEPSVIALLNKAIPDKCKVIHADYLKTICSGNSQTELEFKTWLRSRCHVARTPKLFKIDVSFSSIICEDIFEPSCEWIYLAKNNLHQLLVLLRNNWEFYKGGSGMTVPSRKEHLFRLVGSLDVPVKRHTQSCRPFRETVVLTEKEMTRFLGNPFLAPGLPDPQDSRWLPLLQDVGIALVPNLNMLLSQLETMKSVAIDSVRQSELKQLYGDISREVSKHTPGTVDVRSRFEEQPLVFYPTESGPRWLALKECSWSPPKILRNIADLKSQDHYEHSEYLFSRYLGLEKTTLTHFIVELQSCGSSEMAHVEKVLKTLGRMFDEGKVSGITTKERDAFNLTKAFPVHIPRPGQVGETDVVLKSSVDESWYIPDQPGHTSEFMGKVPLLALDEKSLEQVTPLLEKLRVTNKYLSRQIDIRREWFGELQQDQATAKNLQLRLPALVKLRAKQHHKTRTGYFPTYKITVWKLEAIEVTKYVGNVCITAGSSKQPFTFVEAPDKVDIFIQKSLDESASRKLDIELAVFFRNLFDFDDTLLPSIQKVLAEPLADIPSLLTGFGINATAEELGLTKKLQKQKDDGQVEHGSSSREGDSAHETSSMPEPTLHGSSTAEPHVDRAATTRLPSLSEEERPWEEVGRKGEIYANKYFSKHIRDWNPVQHWTSNLRTSEGFPSIDDEWTRADFTYPDSHGLMKNLLSPAIGLDDSLARRLSDSAATYHIELKTTSTDFSWQDSINPATMSQNQVDLARKYTVPQTGRITDIYIILRLSNVHGAPARTWWVDPWKLFLAGRLSLRAPGGYEVNLLRSSGKIKEVLDKDIA